MHPRISYLTTNVIIRELTLFKTFRGSAIFHLIHKHEIFLFFLRNQIRMVLRACNTRFLKIIFDLAEIFKFEKFLRRLRVCYNRFHVGSVSDEIVSAYAQLILNDGFYICCNFRI
jgi:hypothetical protein